MTEKKPNLHKHFAGETCPNCAIYSRQGMPDLYHVIQQFSNYFTYSCRIDQATTTYDGIKYYCSICKRYVRPDKIHKTKKELGWKT